ncbi:MAG: hypothetical protein ACE5OR_13035 [bacterium]
MKTIIEASVAIMSPTSADEKEWSWSDRPLEMIWLKILKKKNTVKLHDTVR